MDRIDHRMRPGSDTTLLSPTLHCSELNLQGQLGDVIIPCAHGGCEMDSEYAAFSVLLKEMKWGDCGSSSRRGLLGLCTQQCCWGRKE